MTFEAEVLEVAVEFGRREERRKVSIALNLIKLDRHEARLRLVI